MIFSVSRPTKIGWRLGLSLPSAQRRLLDCSYFGLSDARSFFSSCAWLLSPSIPLRIGLSALRSVFVNRRDLNRIGLFRSFARLLMVRKATEDITPITAPMNMNHATARIALPRPQVRQLLPDTSGGGWVLGVLPGVLPAFSTCIITV